MTLSYAPRPVGARLSLDAALKRIEKNVTGVQGDGANPADLDRMRGGPGTITDRDVFNRKG
jgi:hypothetical protein